MIVSLLCAGALFLTMSVEELRSTHLPRGAYSGAGPAHQVTSAVPDPSALMQRHFGLVLAVHDAAVRGDLPTARKHAGTLRDQPDPQGLPATAAPYVEVMNRAAGRVAAAAELEDVASATAAMLAACGDCHRAAGTMPAIASSAPRDIGGAVGHMLAHKHAVDLMVQGLTIPSASSWEQGAKTLRVVPLRKTDLPRDPKLTREIAATETQVHELADRAEQATDTRSRIFVYSELIQSCATCHALHGKVWGPPVR